MSFFPSPFPFLSPSLWSRDVGAHKPPCFVLLSPEMMRLLCAAGSAVRCLKEHDNRARDKQGTSPTPGSRPTCRAATYRVYCITQSSTEYFTVQFLRVSGSQRSLCSAGMDPTAITRTACLQLTNGEGRKAGDVVRIGLPHALFRHTLVHGCLTRACYPPTGLGPLHVPSERGAKM